jgi:hypothetical protein
MDEWLDRIDADKSTDSAQHKAERNKPEGFGDACWGPNEEKIAEPASYNGRGRCNELYPAFNDPRTAAGAPLTGEVLKCTLKPVDAKDYKQPLNDSQLARLKNIFPQGTCDFSRPGVGQSKLGQAWVTYGAK